jgi:soluble lytic murein transglycosylase
MRFLSQSKTFTLAFILIISVVLVTFTIVSASSSESKGKSIITGEIVQYLKDKKVRASDDKLRTIADSVYEEAKDYEIDYRLVLAVMKVESNFKSNAISKKGARGLLQIKPSLARYVSKETGVAIKSPKCLDEPEKNIRIGVSHLSWLMEKFENLNTALHAYNVGLGKVKPSSSEEDGPDTRFTRKVLTEYHMIKTILPDPDIEQ